MKEVLFPKMAGHYIQGSMGQIILQQTSPFTGQTVLTYDQIDGLGLLYCKKDIPYFDKEKFEGYYFSEGGENHLLTAFSRHNQERRKIP